LLWALQCLLVKTKTSSNRSRHERPFHTTRQIAAIPLLAPRRHSVPGFRHHPGTDFFPHRHRRPPSLASRNPRQNPRSWVQDLRTKQLEPILKFYVPDAVFLQPTGERITGSAALRTLFQTIMATFNSDLTLHSQNLETSGDLAYDSGDFQETLTTIATGAKITAKGSYIIIFKRQPNGSWQIVQHVWTGTPPPGAALSMITEQLDVFPALV
jgi:ketosteroid isomerase-like protein